MEGREKTEQTHRFQHALSLTERYKDDGQAWDCLDLGLVP